MKIRYIVILAVMSLVAAESCRKMPSASDFDGEFMVYTAYSRDFDFGSKKTFTVADSLLSIESEKGKLIKNSWTESIRSQYIKIMTDRGFTYVDTGSDDTDPEIKLPLANTAELGIQISYVVSTDYFTTNVSIHPDYWWGSYPGYWNPGYWGNWGSWYYSFPVTYSYSKQSLLTEIVDLTAGQGKEKPLPVVWNSYIDGEISNAYLDKGRFVRAVAQSFEQSEYVASGK